MNRIALMSSAASTRSESTCGEPIAVRLREAVRVSGLSRSELYRRNARGEVIFRKCGKAVLVDYASLKAAVLSLPTTTVRIAA